MHHTESFLFEPFSLLKTPSVGITMSQGNTVLLGILDMPRNQHYYYCSFLRALTISSAINLD